MRDWVAALTALQGRYGPFLAVIGHSFGGFAALTAARHGLQTDAVVTIAAAGAPSAFLGEFARMMSLDADTRDGMERLFLRRIGEDAASLGERYDGVAHPLDPEVPLLVIHGTTDRQLPATESERLHDAHVDSRLLLVDGAGHTRVLAAPEVLAVVSAFIDDPAGVRVPRPQLTGAQRSADSCGGATRASAVRGPRLKAQPSRYRDNFALITFRPLRPTAASKEPTIIPAHT